MSPAAQAERELGHAHIGMGAWMGQDPGGVHVCLTTAGATRRDEHPRAVGVVTPYCPRTRSTPSDGLILRWTLAGSRRS